MRNLTSERFLQGARRDRAFSRKRSDPRGRGAEREPERDRARVSLPEGTAGLVAVYAAETGTNLEGGRRAARTTGRATRESFGGDLNLARGFDVEGKFRSTSREARPG